MSLSIDRPIDLLPQYSAPQHVCMTPTTFHHRLTADGLHVFLYARARVRTCSMCMSRYVDAKCVQHWWWRPTRPALSYKPGDTAGCAIDDAAPRQQKCEKQGRREGGIRRENMDVRVGRRKGAVSYVVPGSSDSASSSSSPSRSPSPSRPSRGPGLKQRMSIFLDVLQQKESCAGQHASSSSSSKNGRSSPVHKRSRGEVFLWMLLAPDT